MRRIRTAPLPPRARRTLTDVAGVTAGIYGAEVTALPAETLESFRTAALNAWWGARRKQRAPGVARALLARSHRIDPKNAITYNRFMGLRRALIRRPHLREAFEEVWSLRRACNNPQVPGPVGLLYGEVESLGWEW